MAKFVMRRINDDVFTFWSQKDKEAARGLKPNIPLRAELMKMPSLPAHNLYHAVINMAAATWPENTEPWPEGNPHLLRAWLSCQAGTEFCEIMDGPIEAAEVIIWQATKARSEGHYTFFRELANKDGEPFLRLFIPRSQSFSEMTEDQRYRLREAVFPIIESTLGISDLKAAYRAWKGNKEKVAA
jgi:hypothetical protein